MVIIDLMDDHRLRSADKQWIFEIKTSSVDKKTGATIYKPIGYYSTIDGAVKATYGYFQRRLDANGVVEFMEASRRLLDQFTTILTPKFEVIEK